MSHIIYQHNTFTNTYVPEHKKYYCIDHFTHTNGTKTLSLANNANLHYIAIIQDSNLDLVIENKGENGTSQIAVIIIANANENNKIKVQSNVHAHHAHTQIQITSFINQHGKLNIEWWVYIAPNITKVAGHLQEKNVILWDKTEIHALPKLDVQSNDVQASHGASIDRLDKKKLFYLSSKWLAQQQAKHLMLKWYITNILSSMPMIAEEKIETLTQEILAEIIQ